MFKVNVNVNDNVNVNVNIVYKLMDWSTKLMLDCQALIDQQANGLID